MTLAPLLTGDLGRPTTSFELFPPRTAAGTDAVHACVAALAEVAPDFFSVTCGASGSGAEGTTALLRHVLSTTPVTAMAHLTCTGRSRAEVIEATTEILDAGVRNLLVLRGDPPADATGWTPHPDGVLRACDLAELVQVVDRRRRVAQHRHLSSDEGPLSIAVAAFPDSPVAGDLLALKAKQDAGATFAITQVVYEADRYAAFVARARAAGVTLPILPGIIPMTDPARLQRLQSLTGVAAPTPVLARLEAAAEHGEAARHREGIRASVELVRALLDVGAPGVHVYTFNSPHAAIDLLDGARLPAPTAPTTPIPSPAAHHEGRGPAVPAGRGQR